MKICQIMVKKKSVTTEEKEVQSADDIQKADTLVAVRDV